MQKHSDQTYINFEPFPGDESDISVQTIKIRTARKQHVCYSLDGKMDHTIEPGQRYRFEKALIDRSYWGEYKICLKCIDDYIDELKNLGG